MRLPDLAFSDHFQDHNHEHNVDEDDVLDALIGRRIHISSRYQRNGRARRKILAKTDSQYLTVICEEADAFWWVLSAYPSRKDDVRRARTAGVGNEQYD